MILELTSRVLLELKTPFVLVVMRVGGAIASFALSLLMARTMNPAEMGVAMTCLSAAPLATLLVTGSTEAGCLRFLVAYLEKNELSKFRGMVSFNRRVTLVLSVVFLAGAIGWILVFDRGSYDISAVVLLTASATVLLSWQKISSAHVLSLGHVVRAMAPSSFWRQLLLVLSIGLWILTDNALTKEVVAASLVVSAAAVLILQFVLNRKPMRRLQTEDQNISDFSDYRKWTKVGLQLGISMLFLQFSRDLTLVIGSLSLSPEDIGVLGIATSIVGFAMFCVIAVNQSLAPKISQAVARNKIDEVQKKIAITNHLKFWPIVIIFVVFKVSGEDIARIFGPGYEAIGILLPILTLQPLALAFFGPGGHFLNMTGHQFVMLPLSIVTVLLLAGTITLGAYFGGVEGAAFGASATWIFWTVSVCLLARKYVGRDFSMIATIKLFFRN